MNSGEKILYVEDDPDIRSVAQLALVDVGGFDVVLCASGDEALAKAQAFEPDLILLDVMMPGMDGPETLRSLRALKTCAEKPVIFMTAKVQPNEITRYMNMGALGVITKPFNPMTLGAEIRRLWKRI